VRGVVRSGAEEELLHELVHVRQRRRRIHLWLARWERPGGAMGKAKWRRKRKRLGERNLLL
jgi:hypothetical protein